MNVHNNRPGLIVLPGKFRVGASENEKLRKLPLRLMPGDNEVEGYDFDAARKRPSIDAICRAHLAFSSKPANPFEGAPLDTISAVLEEENDPETLRAWLGVDPRKSVDKAIQKRIRALEA